MLFLPICIFFKMELPETMFFYIYSQWISQKAIFEFGYRKFFHVMLATILIIITSVGCTIRPVQLASTKVSTAVENPKAVITFAVDKDWQNNYAPLVEEFQAIHPEIEVQLVNPPSDAWDYSALASTADVVLVNPGGILMAITIS